MLKKLNELTFFFSSKNFTIFNFLLFAFKIIMIKGIVYVQCQRWVVKLSLKEKYLVIFWCHKKKTCFSACNLFFNVWNVVIFPVSENQLLVTELHLDIACIAGSKGHIGNPNSEATKVYWDISLIVTSNS